MFKLLKDLLEIEAEYPNIINELFQNASKKLEKVKKIKDKAETLAKIYYEVNIQSFQFFRKENWMSKKKVLI
jgi:galactokinase/mevalonate kinase-like predicted kinase